MPFAHRSRALAHSLLSVVFVTVLQSVPATAASTPSSATERPAASQRPLPCKPPTLDRDKLTVICALDEAAAAQRVHIKVHLTGSHDDTTASMEVAIGDVPVACDAGSRVSTEGEDGDVTLDCRFTASGRQGGATVLRASAKWFHAQYVGLEVDGHRP
jgi:hypothetical protein